MESLCIEIHAAGCDDEQHQQQHRGEKTTEHSHSHRAAVSTVPPHTAAFISASVAGCPPHVVIVSTADTTASERTACECESECHLSSPDTDSTPIDEEKQPHADHSPECDDTSVLGLTPEIVLATVVATANTHHQPDVDDDLSIMHSVCLDIAEQLEVDFAYHEIADLVRDQPASISPTSESWLSNLSEDEQKSAANERTQPHNLALAQLLDKAAADRLIARGKAQQALTNAAAAREAVRRQSREAVRRQSLTRSDPAGSVESVEPVPPPPPPPVFVHCGICQEEVERSKAVLFSHGVHDGPYPPNLGRVSSVPQCMHRFCRECISSYLAHEITDGKVMRIRCPGREEDGGKQCTCTAPKQFIKKYTEQELFDKYERFLKLKTDDSYRSCPNRECLHVQQKKSGASDSMQCDQCQQLYCFRHDLAHPPGTACSTYEKQLKQEAKQSIEHINENTVRCPWPLCRVKTIKASGCNHVGCTERLSLSKKEAACCF
jgi:hypothetical protein